MLLSLATTSNARVRWPCQVYLVHRVLSARKHFSVPLTVFGVAMCYRRDRTGSLSIANESELPLTSSHM